MPKVSLLPRSLTYLLAVAEYQSFTRAAEALYISQPSLSQQIKQLEDGLGVKLLDRSGRNVKLTPSGEVYVSHTQRALKELESATRSVQDLKDLSRGYIRLGMTPITDYLTTPLIAAFIKKYPGISISVEEMPQSEIKDSLIEGVIDIGVAFSNTLNNDVCPSIAHCSTLLVEKLGVVFSSEYFSEDSTSLSKHFLEETPLVLLNANYALRKQIDQYCLNHGINPNVKIETSSLSAIIEFLTHGGLASILPVTIVKNKDFFTSIPLLPELPHHSISLVCGQSVRTSPACREFREFAENFYSV